MNSTALRPLIDCENFHIIRSRIVRFWSLFTTTSISPVFSATATNSERLARKRQRPGRGQLLGAAPAEMGVARS